MALVAQFTCTCCHRSVHEIVTPSRRCAKCESEIARIEETSHMEKLSLMPLEERVKAIELALYRLNAENRLGALEVRGATY